MGSTLRKTQPDCRRRPHLVVPGHQPRLAPTATGRHRQGTPSHQYRHETQPNLPPATAAIGSHLRPHPAHWRQPSPTRPSRVPPQAPPLTTTEAQTTPAASHSRHARHHHQASQTNEATQRWPPSISCKSSERPAPSDQVRSHCFTCQSSHPLNKAMPRPEADLAAHAAASPLSPAYRPTTDPGSALTATRHSDPSQAHRRNPSPVAPLQTPCHRDATRRRPAQPSQTTPTKTKPLTRKNPQAGGAQTRRQTQHQSSPSRPDRRCLLRRHDQSHSPHSHLSRQPRHERRHQTPGNRPQRHSP